ncbi:MAG: DUF4263 domain-containing protein [Firmicutes bacterium]|nr:DUF4263 domain-containing protein [Bacillota bacterium]
MIFSFNKKSVNIIRTSQVYFFTYKEKTFGINPYIHITPDSNGRLNDYLVGMDIKEYKIDDEGNQVIVKSERQSQKLFTLHTELLRVIVNLEAGIQDRLSKREIDELLTDSFDFEYDNNVTYIRLADINNRIKKYLESFDTLDLAEEIIFSSELKTRHKLLSNFRIELLKAMSEDEHSIERVFKKFQEFLPLIIPGLNGVAEFQFIIRNEDYLENRTDILYDNINQFPNIIELKRANVMLFKINEYRNNTCKLTDEFSSAIQQTNIQRNMMSASESKPMKVLIKSFLIIGNLKEEIIKHTKISSDMISLNFNVVRYNNKDCDIITYDQLIDRIDILLTKK